MRQVRARCVATVAALLVVPAAHGQEPDVPGGVPEHYGALNTYAEGEVVEVAEGGRVLLLKVPRPGDSLFGPPRRGSGEGRDRLGDPRTLAGLPGPGADSFGRTLLVVIIRYAQGWVFIDDPDGGPQRRVRLDDARETFAEGQLFQIGPAPELTSNAVDTAIASQTFGAGTVRTQGTLPAKAIEGWVYVRLNRYRQRE